MTYNNAQDSILIKYNLTPIAHDSVNKNRHVTVKTIFYGRPRLICSVLRASKFAVLKLIEIVILWVYYTIPFGFSSFRHFWDIIFQLFNYFLWLKITDEGSIPEMRI